MPDRSDEMRDAIAELADDVAEALFVSAVESGSLLVGDRPGEEIVAEFVAWARSVVTPTEGGRREAAEFAFITDHRDDLLEQARRHAAADEEATALVLYATWIEHSVNALISSALERNGVAQRSIRTLLRAVNLDAKITALWEVAGIPAVGDDTLRSIRTIAGLRNEFVHYKWLAEPDDPAASSSDERYEHAMEHCERVTSVLTSIADEFLWDGRRGEVLAAFRR